MLAGSVACWATAVQAPRCVCRCGGGTIIIAVTHPRTTLEMRLPKVSDHARRFFCILSSCPPHNCHSAICALTYRVAWRFRSTMPELDDRRTICCTHYVESQSALRRGSRCLRLDIRLRWLAGWVVEASHTCRPTHKNSRASLACAAAGLTSCCRGRPMTVASASCFHRLDRWVASTLRSLCPCFVTIPWASLWR